MGIKKHHYVRTGLLITFLLIVLSSLLILRSLKIASFVDGLEQLVSSGTKGKYKLVIGEAEFQFRELTFCYMT